MRGGVSVPSCGDVGLDAMKDEVLSSACCIRDVAA